MESGLTLVFRFSGCEGVKMAFCRNIGVYCITRYRGTQPLKREFEKSLGFRRGLVNR